MLEGLRQRKPVYLDFEDLIGSETEVELGSFAAGTDYEKFLAKRAFLRQHLDHVAIHTLRSNKALTASDLAELERMLGERGLGEPDDLRRAVEESQGLGLFYDFSLEWIAARGSRLCSPSWQARLSLPTRLSSSI